MENEFVKFAIHSYKSSNLDQIKSILNHSDCPDSLKIKFAYDCAKDLDQYYDIKQYPEVYKSRQECLDLLKDYILNPDNNKINKLFL